MKSQTIDQEIKGCEEPEHLVEILEMLAEADDHTGRILRLTRQCNDKFIKLTGTDLREDINGNVPLHCLALVRGAYSFPDTIGTL